DFNLSAKGNPLLLKLTQFAFIVANFQEMQAQGKAQTLKSFIAAIKKEAASQLESAVKEGRVDGFVRTLLGIRPNKDKLAPAALQDLIAKRAATMNLYAEMLDQYEVNDAGTMTALNAPNEVVPRSYWSFVDVINTLYHKHLDEGDKELETRGVSIEAADNTRFYACYQNGRVYVINPGVMIGSGNSCFVYKVWEFSTASFMALKKAISVEQPDDEELGITDRLLPNDE